VADEPKDADSVELKNVALPGDVLFNLVPSAISIQDHAFRIRKINRAFRELFGDRVGEHCYKVYKGRSEICQSCPMAKSLADGQVHQSEELVRTPDGRLIQMAVQTTAVAGRDGRVLGGMEVATDISRTVASQQELVLLGQAMASMAHYIKNIVTGLEGGIFVVEEGMQGEDENLLQEGWEMVRRNIKRVTRLSRDQLYCSRERPPEKRDVRPNALVCEAVRLYRDRAAQHGVDLIVELDERVGAALLDPDGFHNMLTNLLSNAIDACAFDTTKERHWVEVKTLLDPTGELVLEVSDNGQGIPKDMCSEVFVEMFTSKGRAGTGLGLLVIYRVVCAHGGHVNVLSEEDVGTVFTVIIPLPDQRSAA
jgi:PAS domain S-box-containing protein